MIGKLKENYSLVTMSFICFEIYQNIILKKIVHINV